MADLLDSLFLPRRALEVVSIPNPLSKSLQGKSFAGQTELLTIVFDRSIPPGATLTSEEDGKFISPPEGNWLLFLTSLGPATGPLSAILAFGWWEEKAKHFSK